MHFQSIAYFCENGSRVELLADVLGLDGFQIEVISEPAHLTEYLLRETPRLVVYDHAELRDQTLRFAREARAKANPDLLMLAVADARTLSQGEVKSLRIDAVLHPGFDFEAIHTTVRRLLVPFYKRYERRGERLFPDNSVRFASVAENGDRVELVVRNLSMTGAQLEAEHTDSFKPDSTITLEISEASDRSHPMNVRAIVRWLTSGSIGIEFYEVDRARLRELIDRAAKNAQSNSA